MPPRTNSTDPTTMIGLLLLCRKPHPSMVETGMKRIRSSVFSLILLLLISASAFAQTRRVSGRVTVEGSGEPLVATSVNVVGTSIGGYTDDQGRFTLTVPDGP